MDCYYIFDWILFGYGLTTNYGGTHSLFVVPLNLSFLAKLPWKTDVLEALLQEHI
jgi:hypothetical protein